MKKIIQKCLYDIAYARSGDKGSNSNIGVIAYTQTGYSYLCDYLSEEKVKLYFESLKPSQVKRYELPNLRALNFVLQDILGGGGSRSLRIDSQGKALGQALLEMPIDIPEETFKRSVCPNL
jgi:hypothetical protein